MTKDTNKDISNWAKVNDDLLKYMYEYVIDGEDAKAKFAEDVLKIINEDGDGYGIRDQSDALKRVAKVIKYNFTDETLQDALNEGILNDVEIKEFTDFRKSVEKFDKKSSLLSDKLIEQIDNSGIKGNDILDGLKSQLENEEMSDQDLREYIYNSRTYLSNNLPKEVLENVPDLKDYIYTRPDYGVADTNFDKIFKEENILDRFYELSFDEIDYIARKNGMTGKELVAKMGEAKTVKDRNDIVNYATMYNKDDGFFTKLAKRAVGAPLGVFRPRAQESIKRGEDPSFKDNALDIAESVAYAIPASKPMRGIKALGSLTKPTTKAIGVIEKGATKLPKVVKSLGAPAGGILSNATVPFASEVADAIAYDGKYNPRGFFSIFDVGAGTIANAATPWVLRKMGSAAKKFTNGKGGHALSELGEGSTRDEIVDDVLKKWKGDVMRTHDTKLSNVDRLSNKALKAKYDVDPTTYQFTDKDKASNVLSIAKAPGKTLQEKANNSVFKGMDKDILITPDDFKYTGKKSLEPIKLSKELVDLYDNSGLGATEAAKSTKRLLYEDAVSNFLSNNAGDLFFSDNESPIAAPIPYINIINQWLKESDEKKERDEKQKKSEKRFERLLKDLTSGKNIKYEKEPFSNYLLGAFAGGVETNKGLGIPPYITK